MADGALHHTSVALPTFILSTGRCGGANSSPLDSSLGEGVAGFSDQADVMVATGGVRDFLATVRIPAFPCRGENSFLLNPT